MRSPTILIAIGLCGLAAATGAQADSSSETPAHPIYHVQQVDPDFDVGGMAGPGVQVHALPKTELPSLETRDRAILQAGLQEETAGWDELAKDLLYLRARDASSPDLLKMKYPALPGKKLDKFLSLVQSRR